jgi:ubiquitin-protein ligase
MPKKSNSFSLEGVFFARSGVFKNGVFRFEISLDPSFPQQKFAPVIKLNDPTIFHPLVSPDTQIFDSISAFPTWTDSDHLYELLKFFKYSFENIEYSIAVPRPANLQAVEMYKSDRQKFLEISQETATRSVNEIFTSNNAAEHIFAFDKKIIDEEGLHDQILENMKNLSENSDNISFSFSLERRG